MIKIQPRKPFRLVEIHPLGFLTPHAHVLERPLMNCGVPGPSTVEAAIANPTMLRISSDVAALYPLFQMTLAENLRADLTRDLCAALLKDCLIQV
jgi:hypothetical protein